MKNRLLSILLVLTLFWCQGIGYAFEGYQVVEGDVSVSVNGDVINVISGSNQAIIHFETFDVGANQTINFILPNSSASILNRVTGGSASNIWGSILSNGIVYLINYAGINVAAGAQINTGSFVASTLNLTNQDYLNNNFVFTRDGSNGKITNDGNIQAANGGFVVLNGSAIENNGNIYAPDGSIHLSVGDKIRLSIGENTAMEVVIDESLKQGIDGLQSAIANHGILDSRVVELKAKLSDNFHELVVNNTGVIKTTEATRVGTSIKVWGRTDNQQGQVNNQGLLDASGNGGILELAGDVVINEGTILANAWEGGNGDGGEILVTSTQKTTLKPVSVIAARGQGENSNGGEVIIWSDIDTHFMANAILDVQGGHISGDGGFLEVSGQYTVWFEGRAYGGATNGQAGSVLIDPINIIISNGGGNTVTGGDNPGGVDEAFAEDPGVSVTYNPQAAGTFNGFGDIHLQATNDISVNNDFDTDIATGNAGVDLTLEAGSDININANVTTQNADITFIAGDDINVNAGNTIASNGGNISLTADDNVNLFDSSAVSSGGGNIIEPTEKAA